MGETVEGFIQNAYESLRNGDENAAQGFLKKAMSIDFEHSEVLYALKCLNWWLEKLRRLENFSDPYEQGGFILSQWDSYYDFLGRIGKGRFSAEAGIPLEALDSCQYAMKRFVFSRAMSYFLLLFREGMNQQDPVLLLRTGRCCKGAGDLEEAANYLEQANRLKRDDSAILSELADVKDLLREARAAKVLFKEAFYFDPQGVDLWGLESEMIRSLRDKVRDMGHTGTELAEWIPVWGCIEDVFSIKRELKPVELGRLKQSILSLENEYRSKGSDNPHVKPRLLNRYFWLVDHYQCIRDSSGLIDETMLKIKFIDPVLYDRYRM